MISKYENSSNTTTIVMNRKMIFDICDIHDVLVPFVSLVCVL